jgi:hypothetical protein
MSTATFHVIKCKVACIKVILENDKTIYFKSKSSECKASEFDMLPVVNWPNQVLTLFVSLPGGSGDSPSRG